MLPACQDKMTIPRELLYSGGPEYLLRAINMLPDSWARRWRGIYLGRGLNICGVRCCVSGLYQDNRDLAFFVSERM